VCSSRAGIDFRTASEAELEGLPDPAVLERAAESGRILVSHDKRTLPQHFGEFITVRTLPGVFIVSQEMRIAEAAEELVLIWSVSDAAEWENELRYLPL
jgi:hypothetical protein